MFGDGKVKVIKDGDGNLYINMWEMTQHLINSAAALESVSGGDTRIISDTMKVIASTLCDLAVYELGMEQLQDANDVTDFLKVWSEKNS